MHPMLRILIIVAIVGFIVHEIWRRIRPLTAGKRPRYFLWAIIALMIINTLVYIVSLL